MVPFADYVEKISDEDFERLFNLISKRIKKMNEMPSLTEYDDVLSASRSDSGPDMEPLYNEYIKAKVAWEDNQSDN